MKNKEKENSADQYQEHWRFLLAPFSILSCNDQIRFLPPDTCKLQHFWVRLVREKINVTYIKKRLSNCEELVLTYPPRPMEMAPAATSAMPAVRTMEEVALAPERPAARAKGTVRPSETPMMMSRTISPAVKCFSLCWFRSFCFSGSSLIPCSSLPICAALLLWVCELSTQTKPYSEFWCRT